MKRNLSLHIEIFITVIVFIFGTGIMARLYSASNDVSHSSKLLNYGVTSCRNVAELYASCDSSDEFVLKMQQDYTQTATTDATVSFAEKDNASNTIVVEFAPTGSRAGNICYVDISFCENNAIIYTLETAKYTPTGKGGAGA